MRSSLACRRRRRQISRPFPTWCRSDRPRGAHTAAPQVTALLRIGTLGGCVSRAAQKPVGIAPESSTCSWAGRARSEWLHRIWSSLSTVGAGALDSATGKNSHTPNLRISVTAHLRDEFAPPGHPLLMAGHPGGTEGGAAAGLTRGRSLAVSLVGTRPVQSCQPATSATVCKVGAKACARLQKDTPSGPLP